MLINCLMADMYLFLHGKVAGNLFRAPILSEVMFNALFHMIREPNMLARLLASARGFLARLPGTVTAKATVTFEFTIKR